MKIIKRSGSEVVFDVEKIVAAIIKANESVLDYEKQEREKEVAELTEEKQQLEIGMKQLVQKQEELENDNEKLYR